MSEWKPSNDIISNATLLVKFLLLNPEITWPEDQWYLVKDCDLNLSMSEGKKSAVLYPVVNKRTDTSRKYVIDLAKGAQNGCDCS